MKRSLVALVLLTSVFSAAQDSAPQRVRISSGVASGLIVTKVNPIYPPLARQARIQGTVMLKVFVTKTGDVDKVELVSGHPMLGPAAIEAVKQWKYKPYQLNGEPVEVETTAQVNFALSDKPGSNPAPQQVEDAEPGTSVSVPQDGKAPQRVRVSSGVALGLLLNKINPEYPPEAKDEQIQGVVLLRVLIDKEGSVAEANLISGHPLLAQAAIDAVKQWKYRPYLLNGTPLEVDTQVRVNFTLGQ